MEVVEMRVKQMSEGRIYWSLGRQGDAAMGVEVAAEGTDNIRRTTFLRGKHGRETVVLDESYSPEEFAEILRAEEGLLPSTVVEGGSAKRLLSEAMDCIRRVRDGL
jgi:hypothetical protein